MEANVELNPLFKVTSRSRDAQPYSYEVVVKARDGVELRKVWKVVPSGEYKAPTGQDQDVFVAVLELVERRGGMPESGEVDTSLHELLGILGWGDSGKNYAALKDCLRRIMHTGIESRDAFYSKDVDTYVSDIIRIWDVRIVEATRKAGGRQTASRVRIKFGELFLRSFLAHFLKGLDAEFYWGLSSSLSKRLYRLVDQMRGADRTWSAELFDLKRMVPLADYRYPSKIKQVLDPAHRELESKGFLEDARYDDEGFVHYRVSEAFARKRAAFELSGSPEEFIAIERLLSEGIRGDVARDLVAERGVTKCLRCADAAYFQEGVRNRPGWIRSCIEEDYELPEAPAEESVPSTSEAPGAYSEPAGPSEGDRGVTRAGDGRRPGAYGLHPNADPEAEEVWEEVLARSAEDIDAPSWRVWFEGTVPVAIGDSVLTISVPNSFAEEYISGRFKEILEGHLRDLRGEGWGVGIVVAGAGSGPGDAPHATRSAKGVGRDEGG